MAVSALAFHHLLASPLYVCLLRACLQSQDTRHLIANSLQLTGGCLCGRGRYRGTGVVQFHGDVDPGNDEGDLHHSQVSMSLVGSPKAQGGGASSARAGVEYHALLSQTEPAPTSSGVPGSQPKFNAWAALCKRGVEGYVILFLSPVSLLVSQPVHPISSY
jgi:hypothetical protein